MNTFKTVVLHVPFDNNLLHELQIAANRVIESQKDPDNFEEHVDACEAFDDLLKLNFENSGSIELTLGFVEALQTLK